METWQVQSNSISKEIELNSPLASRLLAYPSGGVEVAERIAEAKSLGVLSIAPAGSTIINGIPILGKGSVGLVVKARHSELGLCALKIRRTDADRIDMAREAALLHVANTAGVGPQIQLFSRNFLIMELAPGEKISSWASNRISKRNAKAVAKSVIDQCYRLDVAGIDHGELSRIGSHVLVSENSTTIVDFESASTSRKVSNLTCAVQALFLYGRVANRIADKLGKPDMDDTLAALRRYKAKISRDSLQMILDTLMPS